MVLHSHCMITIVHCNYYYYDYESICFKHFVIISFLIQRVYVYYQLSKLVKNVVNPTKSFLMLTRQAIKATHNVYRSCPANMYINCYKKV